MRFRRQNEKDAKMGMKNRGKRRIGLLLCLIMLTMPACTAADKEEPAVRESSEATDEEMPVTEKDTEATDEEMPVAEKDTENTGEEISEPVEETESVRKPSVSVEKGMKLSILGDSISTFDGWIPEGNSAFYPQNGTVKEVSQTWWKLVLDELGLELYTNGSSSGSTCFGDSREADPACGCTDYRISQLAGADGEAPDLIVIYMGTNDMLRGAPVGDNDGLRSVEEGMVESLSDSYTMILDKIRERYPQAQVYCCTLLPVGDWGPTESQPFIPFVNKLDMTSAAYSDRIRLIAKNRELPVIDLENCGITLENMVEMTVDGVHPTPAGMQLIADMAVRRLSEEQR